MKKIKLIAIAIMAMMTANSFAGGTVDLNTVKAENNWYTVEGVGAVTNKAGASFSDPDSGCEILGKKTGSNNFTIQVFNATKELIITAQSTSNRTLNTIKMGETIAFGTTLTKDVDFTVSGGSGDYIVPKNVCGNQFTLTFTEPIPANNYINIVPSGNVEVVDVTFVDGADATYPFVKSFTMGEVEAVVDTAAKTIVAELDYGTDRATAIAGATVVMGGTAKTYSVVGDVLTAIDSVDTGKNIDYDLSGIVVAQNPSTDATLKSLSVNGTALADFSAEVLSYTYEIGYSDALPVVTAEKNDNTANMVITDATEIPGNATVVVTAQNGTTVKTYTISFTRADALRELKQVILSNGMKANIYNSEKIIKGGYVGDAPTISSCVVDDGATWKMEGDDLVVTGLDGVSDTYSVDLVAYTPYEAKSKSDAVTFDTTAVDGAYIHTVYGWDSSKGVKWSKPKDESGNMRIREGKNRVYFFFAACDSIDFIGSSAGARDVEVTINGVVYSQVTKTPAQDASIRINVGGEAAMIGFESNGTTNGDSGFASMIVYNNKLDPTALKSAIMSGKAVKFMRNGAMYIRRGNDIFNALGKQVKF